TKTGRDVFDGMTRLKQLHILKAIFKSVLFAHNKTPKVFCLTFGVHVIVNGGFLAAAGDGDEKRAERYCE
ncbi:MAG: hypothetical protein IKR96_02110, partial [Bacteroidales bacterium]|nr:hypothetical protein [Bacteroidales bacterium]